MQTRLPKKERTGCCEVQTRLPKKTRPGCCEVQTRLPKKKDLDTVKCKLSCRRRKDLVAALELLPLLLRRSCRVAFTIVLVDEVPNGLPGDTSFLGRGMVGTTEVGNSV